MKKRWLVFPGYCVGLGGLLLITYRTLLAVGSESKAIIVHVNQFGEQYLDIVCLVFLWVVCLIGLYCLLSLRMKETKKTEPAQAEGRRTDGENSDVVFQHQPDIQSSASHMVSVGVFNGQSSEGGFRYVPLENNGCGNVFSLSVTARENTIKE
jgi:hypothetical protein